jgi:hypothetical protein
MATKLINGVRVEMTSEDLAEQAAENSATQAAADLAAARQAQRDARFTAHPDIPTNTNSIIALRAEVQLLADKVNAILDELRGE